MSFYGIPVITGAVGVHDRFGESGEPWELIKEFEVSAEHVADEAAKLEKLRHACSDRFSRRFANAGTATGSNVATSLR